MKTLITLLLLLVPCLIMAEENPDYQARILLHCQSVKSDSHIGLVVWGIIPDLTAQRAKGLILSGVVFRGKSQWLELMGGTFFNDLGQSNPLLDLRYARKSSKLCLFGEIQETLKPERFLLSTTITKPLGKQKKSPRLGGEVDLFHTSQRGWYGGAGPRLEIPLWKGITFSNAYQFPLRSQDPRIIRTYLTINF